MTLSEKQIQERRVLLNKLHDKRNGGEKLTKDELFHLKKYTHFFYKREVVTNEKGEEMTRRQRYNNEIIIIIIIIIGIGGTMFGVQCLVLADDWQGHELYDLLGRSQC